MDDKSALRAIRNGSNEALCELIDRYTAYVCAIVRNILSRRMSTPDIEEVCADVFTVLWQNASQIRGSSAKAYLGSVARNLSLKKLRECREELPLEEDTLILDRKTPETVTEKRELARLVRQAVESLDASDREIFLRHYFYCQPISQISREMDINLSTVKTRLRRGRDKLKQILSKKGVSDEDNDFRPDELVHG